MHCPLGKGGMVSVLVFVTVFDWKTDVASVSVVVHLPVSALTPNLATCTWQMLSIVGSLSC